LKDPWDLERDPLTARREGDASPFEAFVRSSTATFLAFFGRLGASAAEAEDLVQDLFLKLFRYSETYEPQGRFGAYAFRVARNAWIDRGRRRASRPAEAAGSMGVEEESPEQVSGVEEPGVRLARHEEAEALRAALAELPDKHRLVFELGILQELPYADISAALEIPVGTVKSRMFHAVRKLREALGEDA
jgi:RNA polymerase sigma-70 factor (ECF subfamily)